MKGRINKGTFASPFVLMLIVCVTVLSSVVLAMPVAASSEPGSDIPLNHMNHTAHTDNNKGTGVNTNTNANTAPTPWKRSSP